MVPNLFLPNCVYPSGVLSHPVCQGSLSKMGGHQNCYWVGGILLTSDHTGGDKHISSILKTAFKSRISLCISYLSFGKP